MNKIILDDKINLIEEKTFRIKKKKDQIIINIIEDTDLLLEIACETISILFEIDKNKILKIKNISKLQNRNTIIEYHLKQDSVLHLNEFLLCNSVEENHHVYLEEKNASANIMVRSIATNEENYHILVDHLANDTKSNIEAKAVNIEQGKIHFEIVGNVPKEIKNCEVNQDTRIYTFNQNKCTINPVLLIENNDIVANHAAFIGRFDDEVLFYLMSRGISKKECIHLLIKGFLNIDNDEEILSIIHKYWR